MIILQILNAFSTSILKQIFLKTKTFFKKLECCFLIESTTNENATFPYKTALSETALSEANVKTNRVGQAEWGVQTDLSQRTEFC